MSTVLVSPSPIAPVVPVVPVVPVSPTHEVVHEIPSPEPTHVVVYETPDIYTVEPTTITVTAVETLCPNDVDDTKDGCQTLTPGTYGAPEHTVTITKTSQTYICPYTVVEPSPTEVKHEEPTEHVEPAPAPEEPKDEPKEELKEEPKPAEPKPEPVKQLEPVNKQVVSEKPEEPKGSGHAGISPNGKRWAMTYTPYTRDGQCKSSGEVDSDISKIASKGFTAVRLYATDCDALENIGNACEKHSVKMIIGVFIDSAGISAAGEQVEQIMSWGRWEMVEMFVIGNEAVFNGFCSASELAGFIAQVKSRARSAGYDGPCTTAETLNVLEVDGATLCEAVDVFGANLHPFFNPEVTADQAGSFIERQMEIVSSLCPDKEVFNLECGWPSAGNANGAAEPGADNQKTAVLDVLERLGEKTVFLSFDNDDWKDPGEFGVENHYGCIDVFI